MVNIKLYFVRALGAKIGKNVNFRGKIHIDAKAINLMIRNESTM